MFIFLILALYLLLINILVDKKIAKSLLSILGFFVVLALRSPFCGVDLLGSETYSSASYYGLFSTLTDVSFEYLFRNLGDYFYEYGFLIFTKFVTLFTHDFQIYITIVAIVSLSPIAIVLKKYSQNITLSCFIYGSLSLFIFSFSGLRQTMAISFTIIALNCLLKEKKWQFWLWEILATSFHTSAFTFAIVWVIRGKTLNVKQSVIFLIAILLLMPLQRTILPDISEYLFGSKYSYYDEGGAMTMFFVYAAFLLISFLVKEESPLLNTLRWLCLIAVFFQSFGFVSTGALTRTAFYYIFYFSLLLPYVVSNIKEINSQKVVVFIAECLLCLFFYLVNRGGYLNVVPYKFFWETPALY